MRPGTGAESATRGRRERLPFAQALGHRLRQVRDEAGDTAGEVAAAATRLGVGWDRSTVVRIELGKRQVTAGELLMLPLIYGVPVAELLPTEAARMTDVVTVTPDGLREALSGKPSHPAWQVAGLAQDLERAFKALEPKMTAFQATMPQVSARRILAAAGDASHEATVKAAKRLEAAPIEVAVAARALWGQSLAAERDARVSALGPSEARARQARRGHVTRALAAELQPVIVSNREQKEVDHV